MFIALSPNQHRAPEECHVHSGKMETLCIANVTWERKSAVGTLHMALLWSAMWIRAQCYKHNTPPE